MAGRPGRGRCSGGARRSARGGTAARDVPAAKKRGESRMPASWLAPASGQDKAEAPSVGPPPARAASEEPAPAGPAPRRQEDSRLNTVPRRVNENLETEGLIAFARRAPPPEADNRPGGTSD